jgi:hypothetical protein
VLPFVKSLRARTTEKKEKNTFSDGKKYLFDGKKYPGKPPNGLKEAHDSSQPNSHPSLEGPQTMVKSLLCR